VIYQRTRVEGHERSHTLKISLKGKRKTWGRSLYLEIFLSDQENPSEKVNSFKRNSYLQTYRVWSPYLENF
jgi:hypothetical protein